jgi:L-asparaginase II
MPAIRSTVFRGEIAESIHAVFAAEADANGCLLSAAGDAGFVTTLRSSGKPLQAVPALTHPDCGDLGLTDEEVAICCASHPGTPRHSALAASVLALSGFIPDNLVCQGPGCPPSPLRHGCSGNHAAILLAAKLLGASLDGYDRPDHPAQQAIAHVIEEFSGEAPAVAPDGCGVPTFGISLAAMARAFARLACPGAAHERIPRAMSENPELVGSPDWIDVRLMQVTKGRIFAKTGAEGLLCLGLSGQGRGAAIKVLDGSSRGLGAATIAWLLERGWLSEREADDALLSEHRRPAVKGVDGETVGHVQADLGD